MTVGEHRPPILRSVLPAAAILLFAVLAPSVRAADGVRESRTPPSVVRRTTLLVRDIDASIAFYRDVLGFEVWLRHEGTRGEDSLPYDAPVGAPSRFAIMKGSDPWIGMVGLLQYGEARPLPPAPERLEPGDMVLMLETTDIEGIYERMRAAGTTVLRPPVASEVTGADGRTWTATFLFAFDPDGHLLEINQRH